MHFPLEMQIFLLLAEWVYVQSHKEFNFFLQSASSVIMGEGKIAGKILVKQKTPRMSHWSLRTLNINKGETRLKLVPNLRELFGKFLHCLRSETLRIDVALRKCFTVDCCVRANFLSPSIVYDGTRTFGAIEPCCYTSHNHFPKLGN